jgi:hypothetical protein
MIQADHNVYAVRKPAFYQAAALQPPGRANQEDATRLALNPLHIGSVEPLWLEGVAHNVRIERHDDRLKWVWA